MYKEKTVCVVVPAYNEEKQIGKVIDTIPDYVDTILVIDDVSEDNTSGIVDRYAKKNGRIILIKHEKNKGVGGAIATGYEWARDHKIDVAVVMAGDGQMNPDDLPLLVPWAVLNDLAVSNPKA